MAVIKTQKELSSREFRGEKRQFFPPYPTPRQEHCITPFPQKQLYRLSFSYVNLLFHCCRLPGVIKSLKRTSELLLYVVDTSGFSWISLKLYNGSNLVLFCQILVKTAVLL